MNIKPIELFNDRVDRLLRCELTLKLNARERHYSYEKMINREWITAFDISEDDVDAFILNIRLLIQDSDGFSIKCLAEKIYNNDTIPVNLKTRFEDARNKCKVHGTTQTLFTNPQTNKKFTNHEVFNYILYGGLAHANKNKIEMFELLTQQGPLSTFVFSSFLKSLDVLLETVQSISNINKELITVINANN